MKGGEIVQVQGGHVIRSTGSKDRHSKVQTSKGPRDRRVRLAAHTAIQFYDVQDRLGYDRPSKAVDWLIQKAKNAIDELNEVQGKNNIVEIAPSSDSNPSSNSEYPEYPLIPNDNNNNNSNNNNNNNNHDSNLIGGGTSSFMQSFFPTNSMSFGGDLPRTSNFQGQDLDLSLHTLPSENPVADSILPGMNNIVGFRENFQGMDNWHENGNMENSQPINHGFYSPFTPRELLQSNLLIHAWNEQSLAVAPPPSGGPLADPGSHFDFGFHFHSENHQ